jgi:putative hydrolase of the HAD superfamily
MIVLVTPIQPKAIIFDYGNVLCFPQPREDVEAMAAVFRVPPQRFEEIYWPYRLPYDKAALDAVSYWRTVARDLECPLTEMDMQRLIQLDIRSWAHLDARMMDWARRLRAGGIRTAILSNMPLELRDWIVQQSGWLADFDFATFSCLLGIHAIHFTTPQQTLAALDGIYRLPALPPSESQRG